MIRLAIILLPLLSNVAYGYELGKQWKYVGCYADKIGNRALPHYYQAFSYPAQGEAANFKDMVETCKKSAEEKGYCLFGLQHKSECWGGTEQHKYDTHGKPEQSTCLRGADGYHVGDQNMNAVWMLKVDGGFSNWGKWSSCDKTCGEASQMRSRSCTNPKPLGCGKKCVGSEDETRKCRLPSCSVKGGWSKFSGWSKQCTKTCGGGVLIRTRCCTNPPPSGIGSQCEGPSYQTKPCNNQPCKKPGVDGRWSNWNGWSACPAKCGAVGVQQRLRTCTNPRPSNGGRGCSGSSRETKSCRGVKCDVGTKENPGTSCRDIKNKRGGSGAVSGRFWITVGGRTFQVYCDQTTAGGGWTLVYSYTFTDFNRFGRGSNAITPRPNWPAPGNVRVSTTAPTGETDYNALDFNLWKQLARNEFMIKSNINNWIACTDGSGSLINWRNGNINCRVVNNYTHKCGGTAPNNIQMITHDSYGAHNNGPNLYNSHVNSRLKCYYYLESFTTGVNWPTHDPCGKNQKNHLRSANPHGNIYVR